MWLRCGVDEMGIAMSESISSSNVITISAEIVAAFVAMNSLPMTELPALIQSMREALVKIESGTVSPTPPAEPVASATQIRNSIRPDYLVCLDDDLKFKSLRQHLRGLGMTSQQYRAKWKLPNDYPMVAPNYANGGRKLQKSAISEIGVFAGNLLLDRLLKGSAGAGPFPPMITPAGGGM
jgi:predicted transcriptional regulator